VVPSSWRPRVDGPHNAIIADLRAYYSKHAKNDHLDSKMLARLPLLHPEDCETTPETARQNLCVGS
jgi:hypothetical protein